MHACIQAFPKPILETRTQLVADIPYGVNLFMTATGVPDHEPCRTFSLTGRADLVEQG